MIACDTAARSRAYFTCSSFIPHPLFRELFSGDGSTDGGSRTGESIGSTKAVRRLRRGWNNGHERSLSVLSWTAALSRVVRTVFASMRLTSLEHEARILFTGPSSKGRLDGRSA